MLGECPARKTGEHTAHSRHTSYIADTIKRVRRRHRRVSFEVHTPSRVHAAFVEHRAEETKEKRFVHEHLYVELRIHRALLPHSFNDDGSLYLRYTLLSHREKLMDRTAVVQNDLKYPETGTSLYPFVKKKHRHIRLFSSKLYA